MRYILNPSAISTDHVGCALERRKIIAAWFIRIYRVSSRTNRNRRLKHRHLSHTQKHPPTYTYTSTSAYINTYLHTCIFLLRQYFPSQCTSRFITHLLVNFKSQNHPILSMHFSHFQIYAMCNMTKKEDCRPGVCAGVCTCPYLVESVICLKCNFKFIVFKAVRFGNIHPSSFGVKLQTVKIYMLGKCVWVKFLRLSNS